MPQLNVQYPQGLEDLYGYGGQVMGQRYDIARQNERINQDQALQSLYEQQQKLPLELRQMGLSNDTLEEQLPGVKADSWRKQRDNQVREGIPLSTEQRAAATKIAAQMTDDEWKGTVKGIYDMSVNAKTPEERARARHMYEQLPEIQKEIIKYREQSKAQLALEEARAASKQAEIRARGTGTGGSKPMTMVQYEAMLRQKASEGDETAIAALARLEEDKRRRAAAGGMITDKRVREVLGLDEGAPDTSSTGQAAPKKSKEPNVVIRVDEKGNRFKFDADTKEYIGPAE